jgi:multidrug efflux pump subunit AcrA (membrane-fusion protein)
MSKRDFRFWLTFAILIAVFCEGAYYYKHHVIVRKLTMIERSLQAKKDALTAEQIAAGPVTSMKIVRHDFPITLSADGVISPSDSEDITSEIDGKVKSIEFEDGESVKQNDLLIQIDPKISTSDTTKTNLIAPIDGVLSLQNLKMNDNIQAGQKLAAVKTLDPMKIEFSLNESHLDVVHEGQEITFVVDALSDLFFKGEIYAIDQDVDPKTHSFGLQAMAANSENKLVPGMSAHLRLVTDVRQNALVIPESALIANNNVYVIENGKAKKTAVTTSIHQDGFVEISNGLEQGQEIVVSGTGTIHDGSAVTVEPADDQQDDQPTEETTD